ncbi:hypothetical protein [Methylobacterium nonmethylotrophicum]|nr:hypothetical protein [Methylobacterium nonmethylotrophicum]
MDNDSSINSIQSTLRERIIEHVFIGDALRRLWQHRVFDVEVLRSEFDAGGYDLVMARGKIVRHIQFKTTKYDGKTREANINLNLLAKPSGCVIWMIVNDDLSFHSFYYFGGRPGEPLPDITGFKIASHTKGNAQGTKTERPNHRVVPRRYYEKLNSLDEVLERLFGDIPNC